MQFNFYVEHKEVQTLTSAEVSHIRKQDRVDIQGHGSESTELLKPIVKFYQSNMHQSILQVCSTFAKPSPIQKHTWPILLRGRDVVGIAATGSGKTLAFGLPGLVHVLSRGAAKSRHPYMLVLSPTRELAMQTAKVLADAGKKTKPVISVQCVYGGANRSEQINAMQRGIHIVVATPGRLLDLCEAGAINLSKVSYTVLDEADRMLDMGFERDIKMIMGKLNRRRQTLMFSATWPVEVRNIAKEYLNKPVKVRCFLCHRQQQDSLFTQ